MASVFEPTGRSVCLVDHLEQATAGAEAWLGLKSHSATKGVLEASIAASGRADFGDIPLVPGRTELSGRRREHP
jgi:hypothetical protein